MPTDGADNDASGKTKDAHTVIAEADAAVIIATIPANVYHESELKLLANQLSAASSELKKQTNHCDDDAYTAASHLDKTATQFMSYALSLLRYKQEHFRADVAVMQQRIDQLEYESDRTRREHLDELLEQRARADREARALREELNGTVASLQRLEEQAKADAERARRALEHSEQQRESQRQRHNEELAREKSESMAAKRQIRETLTADAFACLCSCAAEFRLMDAQAEALLESNATLEQKRVRLAWALQTLHIEKEANEAGLLAEIERLRGLMQQVVRPAAKASAWRNLHLESMKKSPPPILRTNALEPEEHETAPPPAEQQAIEPAAPSPEEKAPELAAPAAVAVTRAPVPTPPPPILRAKMPQMLPATRPVGATTWRDLRSESPRSPSAEPLGKPSPRTARTPLVSG